MSENGTAVVRLKEEAETRTNSLRAIREATERELGASGTWWSGPFPLDPDEYNEKFRDQTTALKIYEEMRRGDPTVAACLRAIRLPLLGAAWNFEPPEDASAAENEAAELADEMLFKRPEGGFSDFLRRALDCLWAGFSVHEKIYAEDGGKIWIERFAHRIPSSVREWQRDEKGRLVAVKQWNARRPDESEAAPMPRDKIVLVTLEGEGDDPRGMPLLRSAYKPYKIKSTLELLESIAAERAAVGIPVITMPETAGTRKEDKDEAAKIVKDLRGHERGYGILPHGWTLEMLSTGKEKVYDPSPSIRRQDEAIARNVLASFLFLGSTETGSRSLGESFTDMFMLSEQWLADFIAETLERDVVRPWVGMNWGPGVRPPELVAANIQTTDTAKLATTLKALVDGRIVVPDDRLEEHVRDVIGVPQREEPADPAVRRPAPPPDPFGFPPGGAAPDGDDAEEKAEAMRARDGARARRLREPRGVERFVALGTITAQLDDAIAQAKTVTEGARERIVATLADRALRAGVAGDPSAVGGVGVAKIEHDRFAEQVRGLLERLFGDGRAAVRRELDLQRASLGRKMREEQSVRLYDPGLPASDPRNAAEIVKRRAQRVADDVIAALDRQAADAAMASLRTGQPLAQASLVSSLLASSERALAREVGRAVPEAFGLGRRAEAAEAMEDGEVSTAIYSALLDAKTCGNCSAVDGREYPVGSEEYETYSPPLSAPDNPGPCEGGDLCRCIWVYPLDEEGGV